MSRRRRLCLLAACAAGALLPLAAVPAVTSGATGATPVAAGPAATVRAPSRIEVSTRGDRARVSLRARLVAGSEPVEFWAKRLSYTKPITVQARSSAGSVMVADGAMRTFNALKAFTRIKVTSLRTGRSSARNRQACLNSYSAHRTDPSAPHRSPYPTYCFTNPYALGSVQGVQAGWATRMGNDSLRLPRGRYDVRISLNKRYRQALGLSWADAHATVRVVVRRGTDTHRAPTSRPRSRLAQPAAREPSGPQTRSVAGPRPNLRSVPAWNISVRGEVLRFNATVWNGGDSPLVVDGFRDPDSTAMEAYQYFFDGGGDQVGYQHVGEFKYDDHGTHEHWHFRDFARYRLLKADRTTAVRSRKNSFCLANTDSVDLTVPNAAWKPENTDLNTQCGDEDSMSMRQVLASGWGDTYSQFRAGQAFKLEGLPNGRYYIAVEANPGGNLVESSTSDNVRLRRVWIGGTPGNRRVSVPKVGLVNEGSFSDW